MKIPLIFTLILISACSNKNDIEMLKKDPGAYSRRVAEASGVSLDRYRLSSLKQLKDGKSSVIDSNRSDAFAIDMREELKDKEYWEACYASIKKGLGGDYCFYISSSDAKVLVKYGGM